MERKSVRTNERTVETRNTQASYHSIILNLVLIPDGTERTNERRWGKGGDGTARFGLLRRGSFGIPWVRSRRAGWLAGWHTGGRGGGQSARVSARISRRRRRSRKKRRRRRYSEKQQIRPKRRTSFDCGCSPFQRLLCRKFCGQA